MQTKQVSNHSQKQPQEELLYVEVAEGGLLVEHDLPEPYVDDNHLWQHFLGPGSWSRPHCLELDIRRFHFISPRPQIKFPYLKFSLEDFLSWLS